MSEYSDDSEVTIGPMSPSSTSATANGMAGLPPGGLLADRPARLAVAVTEQLLSWIAQNDLPAGFHLPTEAALAQQFKVSRTVVREAMRALEERGVAVVQQGRGTVVADRKDWDPFDPLILSVRLDSESSTKLFADLAELRMAVECQLAESAARNANSEVWQTIEALLEKQTTLDISDVQYTDLDVAFHQKVAEASGNEIGVGFMSKLAPALRAMRRFTNQIPGAKDHTMEWHRRIFERIRAQDPSGAREAMATHLRWSMEHLLAMKTTLSLHSPGQL
jgi:DNA-binding FadR family transcriptional regulator